MSYNLGRDELFWRIATEKSTELINDISQLNSVEFMDDKGRTYLHAACSAHNLEVAKILLQKGADPNCKDVRGRMPIMSAIGQINDNNPDFLRLFLEYGLNLEEYENGETLRNIILSFEDEELIEIMKEFEE